MECQTCKHWKKKKYWGEPAIPWGLCEHLPSGDTVGIDFYTNNRDGEWVETVVETLPDWFCKEYERT